MQNQRVGDIGDFGKLVLLRHIMEGRRLAVCWYLTRDASERTRQRRYFDYLDRPEEFRHLSPEIFDALREIVSRNRHGLHGVTALETSGLLGDALFHRDEVPKGAALRRRWIDDLVASVDAANLVFLDPDKGIQGTRLTPKHVAVSEIAALRRQDRALVVVQRHSGRRSDAAFIASRMQSLGCDRIELVRLRLVLSRFYVVADHDDDMSERIAAFARKWGNWVKTYRF
jgi:hypothetical protein